MKVFLTGATGFIGQDTTQHLLEKGHTVHVTVRPGHLSPFPFHSHLKVFTADILDLSSLTKAAKGCEVIVHLAANKYHPQQAMRVNLEGAQNIISLAQKFKIKRIINVSSQSTNIERKGIYALSKHLSDQIFLEAAMSPVKNQWGIPSEMGSWIPFSKKFTQSTNVAESGMKSVSNQFLRTLPLQMRKIKGDFEGTRPEPLGHSKSTQIFPSGDKRRHREQNTGYLHSRHSLLDLTILKPSLVYGNDPHSLFGTIAKYIQKLPFVPVLGSGHWISYPIFVRDVSRFIAACIDNPVSIGKTYDLGCKKGIEFNDLVKEIGKSLGKNPKILNIPLPLALMAGRVLNHPFFWKDGKVPPITYDNVLGSNQSTHCNPLPAIKELSISPIPLSIGIPLALKEHRRSASDRFWREFVGTGLEKSGEHGKDAARTAGSAHAIKIFQSGSEARQLETNTDYSRSLLRIAIIGLGKTGLMHAAIFNTFPDVQISALIDTPDKASTIRSLGLPGNFYSSLEEALKHEALDTVFICTPTALHLPQIKSAMKAKLHIFIEKTSVVNEKERQTLQKLTKGYPKTIGVGYFYQFRPAYSLAQDFIRSGKLGEIVSFSGQVLHSEVFGPKKGWLFNPSISGGGAIINPSPHFFSLVYHYFGMPKSVRAHFNQIYSKDIEDEAFVTFNYSKFKGELYSSWSTPNAPILKTELTVTGTKGKLYVQGDRLIIAKGRFSQEITPQTSAFNLTPSGGGDGYYLQDRAFIDSIIRKTKFVNNIDTALNIEKIIFAVYESAATKREVEL